MPNLSTYYAEAFTRLVRRMGHTLPSNRAEIIKNELGEIIANDIDNNLKALKYAASLSVLVDLSLQGWIFDIQGDMLTLKMENENLDNKQKIRYRLSAERNSQFKEPSVSSFIKKMEMVKTFNNERISIRNLIGDKQLLINKIQNGEKICEPFKI